MPSTTKQAHQNRTKGRGRLSTIDPRLEASAKYYFNINMTADMAHQQDNTPGREACQILWRRWSDELIDGRNTDTEDRQVLGLERLKNSYQQYIYKANIQLNKFENDIKWYEYDYREEIAKWTARGSQGKPPEPPTPNMIWENMVKNLNEYITNLQDKMTALDTQTTYTEDTEVAVFQKLQKAHDAQMVKAHDVAKRKKKK